MGQDVLDLIIVLSMALFTMRGVHTGFVGEVAGIVSLLGGFWAARHFYAELSTYLTFTSNPGWRNILACMLIFIAVLCLVAILARIMHKILEFSFVSWADRLAGGILGFCKGVILWSLALLVLQKFFQDAEFMRSSRALPYFQNLVEQIRQWLPPELAAWLSQNSSKIH